MFPPPRQDEPHSIAVASYNIHRCIGSDGRSDAERIAEVIRELDVEIIGLQEVESRTLDESHWFDILAYLPGFKAIPGPTIQRSDGHYGNVLLTMHTAADVQHIDLSVCGREPRGAIDALLKIRGRQVRIIVTHLGLKAGERQCQARKLIDCLCDHMTSVTILLGDINEWFPLSPLLRRFHRYFGKSTALCTFPSHRPWLALDRIWVKPQNALRQLSVHKSPLARIASDHLPLRGVVDFPWAR